MQGYKTYTINYYDVVPSNTMFGPGVSVVAQFDYNLPPGTIEGYLKSIRYDFEVSRLDPVTNLIEIIPIAENTQVRCHLNVIMLPGIVNPFVITDIPPTGVVANGNQMHFFHPQQAVFNSLRVLQGSNLQFHTTLTNALPVDVQVRMNIAIEVQEFLK